MNDYIAAEDIINKHYSIKSLWISKEDHEAEIDKAITITTIDMNELLNQKDAEHEKEVNDWKWKFTEKCIEIESLEQEIRELKELEEGHDENCEGTMCYCAARKKRKQ